MPHPLPRRGMSRVGLRLIASLIASLSAIDAGAAEVGRVEGFGPVSRGMAGAGVAYPVGAAAMLLNPAELLSIESERELSAQITQINAKVTVHNRDTGEELRNSGLPNNRGPYYLPEIAFAMRRGDWAFGTGVFGAGGFGIEFEDDSFLSRTTTNAVETGLESNTRAQLLRIPLALAWRPQARWRLGASLDVVNGSNNLASLLDAQQLGLLIQQGRVSGTLVPALAGFPDLSGAHIEFVRDNALASKLDAWGVAGRVGLSFQATPQTVFAMAYEFETALRDLKGKGRLSAIDGSNNQLVIAGSGAMPEFQYPQAGVIGVSHRFASTFAMTADLRRTFWRQTIGDTRLDFVSNDGGTLSVELPTGFNNLTTVAIGAEWKLRSQLTLRAGAAHALQDAVPGSRLSGAFPTLTRTHVTAGVSWRQAAQQFDFTLSHGFTDVVRNSGGNTNSIPAIESRNRQWNPALAYSLHF